MDYPIIIDYLTFSLKIQSCSELIKFLGLYESGIDFEPCPGRYFFKTGFTYLNEITLYFDNYQCPDLCCVNLSGRGCRDIETFSDFSLEELIQRAIFAGASFSRVDLAIDIIDDNFKISRLVKDTRAGNFKCRSKFYNIMESCNDGILGTSLYFGKQESDLFINIYDKRAERGYQVDDMPAWTRIEIRLRHENCQRVLSALNRYDIGTVFNSMLSKYLVFLKHNKNDTNKSRWEVAPYWAQFTKRLVKIPTISEVGVEYDFNKFESWLFNTCGSSLKAYLSVHSTEDLLTRLEMVDLTDRHKVLVDNFRVGVDYMLLL